MNISANAIISNSTTYESYWPCSALQSLSLASDVYADLTGAFDQYGSALLSTVAARFFQAQHHYFCLGQNMYDATMTTIKTSMPTLLLKLGTWTFNRWVYNAVTGSAQNEINTIKSHYRTTLESKDISEFKTALTTANTDLHSKFATATNGITQRDRENAKNQLISSLKNLYEARKSADILIQTDAINKLGLKTKIDDATAFMKNALEAIDKKSLSPFDKNLYTQLFDAVSTKIKNGQIFSFEQYPDMDRTLKRLFFKKEALEKIIELNENTLDSLSQLPDLVSRANVNPTNFISTGARATLYALKHLANGIYLGADALNHWDIMKSTIDKGLNSTQVFQTQLQTWLLPLSSFNYQVQFFSKNIEHLKHMSRLSKEVYHYFIEKESEPTIDLITEYSNQFVDGYFKKASKESIPALQQIINSLQKSNQNKDHILSFSYSQVLVLQKLLLDLVQTYDSKMNPFKTSKGDIKFYERTMNSRLGNDESLIIINTGKIRQELSDDIIKKVEGLPNFNLLLNENHSSLNLKDSWNPFHKLESHSNVQKRLGQFSRELEALKDLNGVDVNFLLKNIFNEMDYHLSYIKFIQFILEYYPNPVEIQEEDKIDLSEITLDIQTQLKQTTEFLAKNKPADKFSGDDSRHHEAKTRLQLDEVKQLFNRLSSIYQNENLLLRLENNPVKLVELLKKYQEKLYGLANENNLSFAYLVGVDSLNNQSKAPFTSSQLQQQVRSQRGATPEECFDKRKMTVDVYIELIGRLDKQSLSILHELEGIHYINDQRGVDLEVARKTLDHIFQLNFLLNLV